MSLASIRNFVVTAHEGFVYIFVKYILILKFLNVLWRLQNPINKLGFCNFYIDTWILFPAI